MGNIALELANRHMNRHTIEKTREALSQPGFGQVETIWTYATFPDHNNGRCVDYMITIPGVARSAQVAIGDGIAAYFIRHAVRLGVNWLIWNRHIWRRHANLHGPAGWSDYHGPKPHTDHVHVEDDGTSFTPLHTPTSNPSTGGTNHTGEDEMPTPEELWNWDHVPAPDYALKTDPKNKSWKPSSVLVETAQEVHKLREDVAKLTDLVAKLEAKLEAKLK